MQRLILVACFLLPVIAAAQDASLALGPGVAVRYTVPDSPPFDSLGDFRFEIRLHDFGGCAERNYSNVWNFGPLRLRCFLTSYPDVIDVSDGRVHGYFSMAGRTDVLVRIQRSIAEGKFYVELWNTDGSKYSTFSVSNAARKPQNVAGQKVIGGSDVRVSIAWARWYSETLPLGSPPPRETQTADLGVWDFDENAGEQRHGMNMTASGAAYQPTPTMVPVAVGRVRSASGQERGDMVVRAGNPVPLSASGSYSLVKPAALGYRWEQLSGPAALDWSSQTEEQPTVTAAAPGEYTVRLTVTDAAGRESSTDLTFGAVATDDNDIVVYPDPNIEFVFGPLPRLGANLWTWQDENHVALATAYGELVMRNSGIWQNDWSTQMAGTITTKRGSRTITGKDTTFQNDFCGGEGNTRPAGSYVAIVVWAGSYKWGGLVSRCDSQTQITISAGEENDIPTREGVPYSKTLNGTWWGGAWGGVGGSNNANYYDNVLAHYALYYRTGETKYLDYARALADRWVDSPFFLRSPFPRMWSLAGVMWRAYEDGRFEIWDRVHPKLDGMLSTVTTTSRMGDIREDAYRIAFLAIASKLSPDRQRAETYRAALVKAMSGRWTMHRQPGGNWISRSYLYASWNGYSGTVSVVNGSTEVVGTGTKWQSGWCRGNNAFWVTDDRTGWTGDPVSYKATCVDATHLTLDRPYEGETRSGLYWQLSNLVGPGTQPFQLGVVGVAWSYVYKLTADPQAAEFVRGVSDWLLREGVQESTKGLYYGRVFVNCEPIADKKPGCSYDPASKSSTESSRFLNGEVLGALAAAYEIDRDGRTKAKIDRLFGGVFGKNGGPRSDPTFPTLLRDSANGCCPKNYGFFYGFGRSSVWPAVRDAGRHANRPARR